MTGMTYVSSLLYLSIVVIGVYTASRDMNEEKSKILKNLMRRSAQLFGVLIGLAIIVSILGLF